MRTTEWLDRFRLGSWFLSRFRAFPHSTTSTSDAIPRAADARMDSATTRPTVVLWGPIDDDEDVLTQHTNSWLQELKDSLREQGYEISGPHTIQEDALISLAETSDVVRVKVFCGHGTDRALLGPAKPARQTGGVRSSGHGIWYDARMLKPKGNGPSSLFAFCCRAAERFGREFAASGERSFLGFNADIPLELTEREYEDCFRRIIHSIVKDIVNDGCILKEHRSRLRRLYETELEQFRRAEDLMLAAHLLEHRNSIRFWGD